MNHAVFDKNSEKINNPGAPADQGAFLDPLSHLQEISFDFDSLTDAKKKEIDALPTQMIEWTEKHVASIRNLASGQPVGNIQALKEQLVAHLQEQRKEKEEVLEKPFKDLGPEARIVAMLYYLHQCINRFHRHPLASSLLELIAHEFDRSEPLFEQSSFDALYHTFTFRHLQAHLEKEINPFFKQTSIKDTDLFSFKHSYLSKRAKLTSALQTVYSWLVNLQEPVFLMPGTVQEIKEQYLRIVGLRYLCEKALYVSEEKKLCNHTVSEEAEIIAERKKLGSCVGQNGQSDCFAMLEDMNDFKKNFELLNIQLILEQMTIFFKACDASLTKNSETLIPYLEAYVWSNSDGESGRSKIIENLTLMRDWIESNQQALAKTVYFKILIEAYHTFSFNLIVNDIKVNEIYANLPDDICIKFWRETVMQDLDQRWERLKVEHEQYLTECMKKNLDSYEPLVNRFLQEQKRVKSMETRQKQQVLEQILAPVPQSSPRDQKRVALKTKLTHKKVDSSHDAQQSQAPVAKKTKNYIDELLAQERRETEKQAKKKAEKEAKEQARKEKEAQRKAEKEAADKAAREAAEKEAKAEAERKQQNQREQERVRKEAAEKLAKEIARQEQIRKQEEERAKKESARAQQSQKQTKKQNTEVSATLGPSVASAQDTVTVENQALKAEIEKLRMELEQQKQKTEQAGKAKAENSSFSETGSLPAQSPSSGLTASAQDSFSEVAICDPTLSPLSVVPTPYGWVEGRWGRSPYFSPAPPGVYDIVLPTQQGAVHVGISSVEVIEKVLIFSDTAHLLPGVAPAALPRPGGILSTPILFSQPSGGINPSASGKPHRHSNVAPE